MHAPFQDSFMLSGTKQYVRCNFSLNGKHFDIRDHAPPFVIRWCFVANTPSSTQTYRCQTAAIFSRRMLLCRKAAVCTYNYLPKWMRKLDSPAKPWSQYDTVLRQMIRQFSRSCQGFRREELRRTIPQVSSFHGLSRYKKCRSLIDPLWDVIFAFHVYNLIVSIRLRSTWLTY
jgi:hypothetical protein